MSHPKVGATGFRKRNTSRRTGYARFGAGLFASPQAERVDLEGVEAVGVSSR